MSITGYEIAPRKFSRLSAKSQNKSWIVRQASTLETEENHFVFDSQDRKWRYARKSNIDGSLTLGRERWKPAKDVITISSAFDRRYEEAKKRIVLLCQNQNDEFAPNQKAKEIALEILDFLRKQKIMPSLINSTGDKSLLFEFFTGENSFSIDIYNSGEIIYLSNIQGLQTHVIEFAENQIKEVVAKITHDYVRVTV